MKSAIHRGISDGRTRLQHGAGSTKTTLGEINVRRGVELFPEKCTAATTAYSSGSSDVFQQDVLGVVLLDVASILRRIVHAGSACAPVH